MRRIARSLLLPLLALSPVVALPAQTGVRVQDASCFAVETLDARTRVVAEAMLVGAADGEGLYTLVDGLKPVSSDFAEVTYTVAPDTDRVALDSLTLLRRAAAALRCGPVAFTVVDFAATYPRTDGTRYRVASTYVVHRESVARMIAAQQAFWDSLGVTTATPAESVLAIVERAPRTARWRGYGHLFGYPDTAVAFFVAAGRAQDSTGTFVPRDFRRVETFRKFAARDGEPPTLSSFVYAVPKGAAESPEDRALVEAAAPILARYRAARGDGSAAVALALWRAWIGSASADPFTAPRPRLRARRAASALTIDGRLDEADWAVAAETSPFHQVRPDYSAVASSGARVRVLYDDRHLYFGAVMRQPAGPRQLRVRDLRRDFDWSENENFSMTIGPLGDRRTSYQYTVTPHGSQRDTQVFDGGDTSNENWDGQWRVRTTITDSTWVAEVAIPWETMRYVPDSVWELNLLRNARATFETAAWAPFPRQLPSNRLTFAGQLEGLAPPPPRAGVRVRPYALASTRRGDVVADATAATVGGEVLWNPSAASTLDLTVRTDFAQADVDRQVVNLQRFGVFFPERRQFFLENSDLTSVRGLTGRYVVQPFFTRTIGLAGDGTPIPIDAGMRYALRSARTSVGALVTHQQAHAGNGPATIGVVRGSRNFAGATRLGALVAVRHDAEGDLAAARTNVVTAFDAIGRIGEQVQFNGMVSTSTDGDRTGVAVTYFAGRDTPRLYTGFLGGVVSRDYQPRTGFVSRPDVIVSSPAISSTLQPAWRPKSVVWFKPAVITYFYNSPGDGRLQEGWIQAYVDVLHGSGALWYPYVERHLQRPTSPVALLPGVTIDAGRMDAWRTGWYGSTDKSARWMLSTNVSTGGFFDGRRDQVAASARWAPTPRVAVNVDYEMNHLESIGTADTTLTTHLVAPELRLAWSPRLQLSTFYQYNTSAERGALNARLSWEFAPLSFVYLVMNDSRAIRDGVTPMERSLVLKVVWLGAI